MYSEFESLGSGMTETLRDNRVEQAADDAVKFDSSIDARSARVDCGFYIRDIVKNVFVEKKKRAYTYNNIGDDKIQKGRFGQR